MDPCNYNILQQSSRMSFTPVYIVFVQKGCIISQPHRKKTPAHTQTILHTQASSSSSFAVLILQHLLQLGDLLLQLFDFL